MALASDPGKRNLAGVKNMRLSPVLIAARLLLASTALLMALWSHLPWLAVLFLSALTAALFAAELVGREHRALAWAWATTAAWGATLLVSATCILQIRKLTVLDTYFGALAWIMTAAVALTSRRSSSQRPKKWLKHLAFIWALYGSILWLGATYSQNLIAEFYFGLLVFLVLLVVCKLAYRLPGFAVLTANSVMLFVLLLPVVDWITHPARNPDRQLELPERAYSFELAKHNPHAFIDWWNKYLREYDRMMRDLFIPDPASQLPYLVRTNTDSTFFQSHIHINELGFRGREIPRDKGDAYRIVVIGESTTFGFTLNPEHKPWPEVLEELIVERLKPTRPIEVINAGLPHHNLKDNLVRLRRTILSLKPDLIISYHGYNGLAWLLPSLPPIYEKHVPVFKFRPVRLLAECEYTVKLGLFKRRFAGKPIYEMPSQAKLLNSPFAQAYRELIELGRTNHVKTVIGNYSMAVNPGSDPKVIEFYRQAFPAVYWVIRANLLHTALLDDLATKGLEFTLVNTHPNLDGVHENFIDLVHFAPDGERRLAETFFQAIEPVLQAALSPLTP